MASRESHSPPRASRSFHYPYHPLSPRVLLTPTRPSLDSLVAVVTSTPPIPTFSFSANGFNSFSHTQSGLDPSTGLYTSDPLLNDPPGSCGVKEDVWFGAQSTSPSSPFTYVDVHSRDALTLSSIDSQPDSQAGGDYIPPAPESSTSESPSAQQHRRPVPNLNISLPPNGIQLGAGFSPVSLVSSGAPFTDSLSMNFDPAEDYFRFSDAALSSAPGEVSDPITTSISLPQSTRPTPSPHGVAQGGPMVGGGGMLPATASQYRLPASQPSSPVRGVFMSGQQQFQLSPAAGRQRSTTVSGISPFEPNFAMAGFGQSLGVAPSNNGTVSAPVTALPAHLAFTAIHSPVPTPLAQSPSIVASAAASPATERVAYFGGDAKPTDAQTGTGGDVTMEDATNPSSRRSSAGSPQSNTGLAGAGGSVAQAVANASGSAAAAAAAAQAVSTNDIAERLTMERLTMLDK